MTKPIEKIIARLDGVRKTPAGYIARCPAHDDRKASLSISESEDGKALLKCHAGCTIEDICRAAGLDMKELFPENGRRDSGNRGTIVAEYDYTDEAGTLLFQALRFVPKGFMQRRPDGAGGWLYSLAGCRRVLYRLPKVVEAVQSGRVVFIVEGEKDVHSLEALGFVATCNPMGAGSWKGEYSDSLLGALVVILPDNDEPGREHARDVARSLWGKAKEIRLATLPGLPEKGDVSDWIKAGGTAEDMKRIVGATPPLTERPADNQAEHTAKRGSEKPSAKPRLTAPSETAIGKIVADVKRERLRWLWKNRLALGKITILDGDPGLGKSTLYCDLTARITTGRPFPGEEAFPVAGELANVVIVTCEDSIGDTIRPRLEEAGADLNRVRVIQTVPEIDSDTGETIERPPVIPDDVPVIEAAIKGDGAVLLVIDPLMGHLGGGINAFKDQDVRRALAPVALLAEKQGISVLVVRHLNKAPGGSALYRGGGSIGIIGAARLGLLLGKNPDDSEALVLAVTKANIGKHDASQALRIVSSPNDPEIGIVQWEGASTFSAQDLVSTGYNKPPTKKDEAAEWLLERLASGPVLSQTLLREGDEKGYKRRTLFRAKEDLGIKAEAIGSPKHGGSWQWVLPDVLKSANYAEELAPLREDDPENLKSANITRLASLSERLELRDGKNGSNGTENGDFLSVPTPSNSPNNFGTLKTVGTLKNGSDRPSNSFHVGQRVMTGTGPGTIEEISGDGRRIRVRVDAFIDTPLPVRGYDANDLFPIEAAGLSPCLPDNDPVTD